MPVTNIKSDWVSGNLRFIATVADASVRFGDGTTATDVYLYGASTSDYLLWDGSASKFSAAGAMTMQVGEATTGVTTAGGTTMLYGYAFHKTNALTGTLRGVRGNARLTVASAAGTVLGGHFQAANGTSATATDGVNLGEANGLLAEVVGVTPASASTITKAVAGNFVADVNQATNAITTLFGVRIALQSGASQGTVTNSAGLVIINENVEGAGTGWGSAIAVGQISRSAGWAYGLNLAPSIADGGNGTVGTSAFSSADIRLSNGLEIATTSTTTSFRAVADDDVIYFGISGGTQKSFDLQWYGNAANGADSLLFDASASKITGSGAITMQLGESTTGVTTAGGTSMIYAYGYHKTNALTGTLRALRGNAVCHVASANGIVEGVFGRAGNGKATTDTDGVNLGTARGGSFLVAGVGQSGPAVLSNAQGVYVQLDINSANLTVSDARGIYVNIQSGNASANTLTACNLAYLEYESVVGTAPAINAGIKMACVGGNSGILYLIDASTVTPVAKNTNQNVLIAFKDTTGTTQYLVYDPDNANVVAVTNSLT